MSGIAMALENIERVVSGFGTTRIFDEVPVDAAPIEKAKKNEVVVKGFASMTGVDRDGDNIDPLLFDIDSYMKNPIVYWNHKAWKRKEGNEVSVGVTEVMHAVSVKRNESNAALYDLTDLHSGALVETIDGEEFLVKDGDKGLWVHVRVMEPDIVKMIREERAKAFSWKGALRKTHDTRELKIDMYEVSLVTVPAQNRSLFAIAKAEGNSALNNARVYVTPDMQDVWLLWGGETMFEDTDEPRYAVALVTPGGSEVSFLPRHVCRTEAEAKAVARAFTWAREVERIVVLLKPTGKKLEGGSAVYDTEVIEVISASAEPTAKELSLFRLLEREILSKNTGRESAPKNGAGIARDNAASQSAGEEGGELSMGDVSKLLEAIDGISKSVSTLMEKQAAQDSRIEEIVKAQAPAAEPVVPKTDDTPAAPVAKSTDGGDASAPAINAEPKDESYEKVANALTGIAKTLEALSTRQAQADARIATLEKKPTGSNALGDVPADNSEDETAAIMKRFNGLDESGKSTVVRTALGMRMIPAIRAGGGNG